MKTKSEHGRPDRRRFVAALGLLVGLGALALTFRNVDLRFSELLRAAAVTTLVIVPIGYLLTTGLSPSIIRPGERFALASIVGYSISAATYYFLSVLNLQPAFPAVIGGATIAVAILQIRTIRAMRLEGAQGTILRAIRWVGSRNWLLFALLGLILLATTRGYSALVPVEGGLAYNHEMPDHTSNLSRYWEMLRGIPPKELPTAAGVPFPQYHIMATMLGVLLVKYGGLGVITIYHAIMPVVHLALFAGAVYIAVRVRTGSTHVASASLVTLFFISNPFEALYKNRLVTARVPFEYLMRQVSAGGGMVIWATITCLLMLYAQGHRQQAPQRSGRRLLYLAAVLVGLSYFFKAHFFAVFGAAYFLALLTLFLRDRTPELLWAGGISLLVFAMVFLSWRTDSLYAGFSFSPGLYAQVVYRQLRQESHPFFHETLLSAFRALPVWLGWLAATVFGLWRVLHFSLLVPLYFLYQARSFRSIRLGDAMLCLALPIGLLMAYVLSGESYLATTANPIIQAITPLALLATILDVAVIAAILDRLRWMRWNGGKIVLVGTLLVSVCLLPMLLKTTTHVGLDNLIVLSPGEQGALIYLREKTPLDAVVVNARTDSVAEFTDPEFKESILGKRMWLNHYAVVSGLAGRRSVLEYFAPVIDKEWDREEDIRTLFSTADAAEAKVILDRYAVDYILEYAGLQLKFSKAEANLHLVYVSGDVRIYQVGERLGESLPEGPLYSPSGLR